MLKYEIIGESFQSVYEKHGDDDNYNEIIEEFYRVQLETFFKLFVSDDGLHGGEMIVHYFDSDFRNERFEMDLTHYINEYIDGLAIKEGVNLVRFENGNIGFVGVYGAYENGFEVIHTEN